MDEYIIQNKFFIKNNLFHRLNKKKKVSGAGDDYHLTLLREKLNKTVITLFSVQCVAKHSSHYEPA